jgi:hypothetical protein
VSELARNVTKARLSSAEGSPLVFEFNPSEISISHNAEGLADPVGTSKGGKSSWQSAITHSYGSTRLVMSTITFSGNDCKSVVVKLMKWVEKPPKRGGIEGQRVKLKFEWGSVGRGFLYKVELVRFDCTYTRFTRDGRPIRAEIRNMTLHVLQEGKDHGAEPGKGSQLKPPTPTRVPAGLDGQVGPNADPGRALAGLMP